MPVYFRHPVVSAFIWQKWQGVCNDVRQNLRSSAIFTITASRAILTAYDVKLTEAGAIDGHIVEKNITSKSCHYQHNWIWSPTEGFNLTRLNQDTESGSHHFEIGFWVTAFQCLGLLLLILRCKILTNFEIHNSNFRDPVFKFWLRKKVYSVRTSFTDILFLCLAAFVCIVGSRGLGIVTIVMAVWMLWEEAVQMKTQKADYFKSKENWLDMAIFTLPLLILFLPDM